ncbi:CoA ester lyase [Vineibacter terrae]|uniref:CoA ester lyase n=1 Tax=Vineibacter terrae TaxID=2586908 RepID=A0A5C8PEB3_9HYPH|nr:CoA ester lyase [Vineibacter terrae]TXL72129.1 CoA ester lyase [Vineibacter terrae]
MTDQHPPRPARIQRSELAVPATSERFFEKARQSAADVIFLDLEDAVAPAEKTRARQVVVEALNDIDWGRKTMVVRVNGLDTEWGYRDVVEVAERCPRLDMVLLPKVQGARDVEFVDTLLAGIEAATRRATPIGLEALIETAMGLANIRAIAGAVARLEALIFGVGDFIVSMETPDLIVGAFNADYAVLTDPDDAGSRRRAFNDQWHYALARVASTCRAFGLRPIDGPYTNYADPDGYRASALRSRALGFEGKWAIHPAQIPITNEVFTPSSDRIAWARRAIEAMRKATSEGHGATGVNGELFDMAHIKLAENILRRADAIAELEGRATA